MKKPIMRALGEFFGHVAHGVKTPARPNEPASPDLDPAVPPASPPPTPERRVLRETVEEEERQTPQGKVTLRRTIIEEVEIPSARPAAPPDPPSTPAG